MRLADLDRFSGIGWDVDGTLVGHPANRLFFSFIRLRRSVRHVIVSFRSHGAEATIFRDIEREGGPGPEFFEGVHTVDDALWEAQERARLLRLAGALTGPPTEEEIAYREFKARTCFDLGIPCLIDDDISNCKPGCDAYGIMLIHPDAFLRQRKRF